jgi:hypothetical protein
MERFVHIQNIAHFRKVLSETTDPTKQQTVQKLLAVELAKDRAHLDEAIPHHSQ